MPVMIVSSIIISKDIISFINLGIGQNRMWRMVHIPLFKGIVKSSVNEENFERVWGIGSRVLAILMSIFEYAYL